MPNEARRPQANIGAPLAFKYSPDLPISARREEITEAIGRHQVLIVAGDTGSGKSTQLPQYCLAGGRGSAGLIAHTQPRRIAARALAARIAQELSQPVGEAVGFRVRFADRVSAATRLVLMTDGLLLAEIASDPLLRRYDTVIVDEAHERTLNIDLLLGVLKRLLPKRPDLKVIVTSATLEVLRVSEFFGGAPVITVSGRGHPIEVRYAADAADQEDPDLPLAVLAAYRDIASTPGASERGDVLVFLPGEREIRDVGDFLQREIAAEVEVLPLYSRLSWEQQSRIFERGPRRRVVLATNVAETSITVPGIRAVIDSGLARVSRYSPRNRLQRLPIEPVSRASADQRKGRCGREGPGLCVRLYAEQDFEARAAFTEPEVLRTNLAALLLRLAADGLGDAENFPFIDAPDSRALGDGYRLLQELEALDAERRITRRGRAMARLPLDPRLARALLESKRFHAEEELLAIVAGLSVPDPRLAGVEGGGEDPAAAAPFEDGKSEFSALVKLWRAYRKTREGPRRELRRWCKERGLSALRLSEWEDVYLQVADRAAEVGIVPQRRPASYTGVHRALLAGFCTMVGVRADDGAYLGTRGVRFHIFPGSPLKRRKPRWVMAANIVETSRVFARRVAEIEPTWLESAVPHLLKREYLEPDWSEAREQVVARERVSFLGLILSANRIVNYGPIAPEESRLIFAREALVYRRMQRRPDWLARNDASIDAAQAAEERLRTRDLLRPAEFFVEFYDRALPRQVSSTATLEYFTRNLSEAQSASLTLAAADVFARVPDPGQLGRYPTQAPVAVPGGAAVDVAVDYRFEPGESDDGATLRIPLLALPALTRSSVDAVVPGFAAPCVEALLRSLPKEARRGLIPIAATAADFIHFVGAPSTDTGRLASWLQQARGVPSNLLHFDLSAVPLHLVPRFAVQAPASDGAVAAETRERTLAQSRDLATLRRRCAAAARLELDRRARLLHPDSWRRFEAQSLGLALPLDIGSGKLEVFTALSPSPAGAVVRFEWSQAEAERLHHGGCVALARQVLAHQTRDLAKALAGDGRLLLAASPYLRGEELTERLLQLTFARACFSQAQAPRTRAAFDAAVEAGRAGLYPAFDAVVADAGTWFAEARRVRGLLDDSRSHVHPLLIEDTQAHLLRLLGPGGRCYESINYARQLPRYLKAERRRLERLHERGAEAPQIVREALEWQGRAATLGKNLEAERRWLPQFDELCVAIEEYRVSLYAQELRGAGAVSAARLAARAAEIEAWLTR